MATNTPNLQLRKVDPDLVTGDNVDVELDLNANWDILDDKVQDALDGNSSTRPIAQLRNTAVTSIPNNAAPAAVVFQTEDKDSHNGHDAGSNPTRYTCPTAQGGVYKVSYKAGWTAKASTGSSDIRQSVLHKNSVEVPGTTDQIRALDQATTQPFNQCPSVFVDLAPGDFLELKLFQNSGAALDTFVGTTGGQTVLNIEWIRP